jgi:hypothetical protein
MDDSSFILQQGMIKPGTIKERHLVSSGTIAPGDLFYGDGTNSIVRLPIGTDNQVVGSLNGNLLWTKAYGYTIQMFSEAINPVDGTDYYFGCMNGVWFSAGRTSVMVPDDGLVRFIGVNVSNDGTLGTAETSSLYLLGTSVDPLTITSSLQTNSLNNYYGVSYPIDDNIAVQQGDLIEVKWTAPTWVTDPTYVRIGVTVYIQ